MGLAVVGLMGVSATPAPAKTPRVAKVSPWRARSPIRFPSVRPTADHTQCQQTTGLACYSPGPD